MGNYDSGEVADSCTGMVCMSPKHLALPESKEVLKKGMGTRQKDIGATLKCSHCLNLAQCEQQCLNMVIIYKRQSQRDRD